MNYQTNPVSSNLLPVDLITCTTATGTYQDCNRYVEKPPFIDNSKYWSQNIIKIDEYHNNDSMHNSSYKKLDIHIQQDSLIIYAKPIIEEYLRSYFVSLRNSFYQAFSKIDLVDLFLKEAIYDYGLNITSYNEIYNYFQEHPDLLTPLAKILEESLNLKKNYDLLKIALQFVFDEEEKYVSIVFIFDKYDHNFYKEYLKIAEKYSIEINQSLGYLLIDSLCLS